MTLFQWPGAHHDAHLAAMVIAEVVGEILNGRDFLEMEPALSIAWVLATPETARRSTAGPQPLWGVSNADEELARLLQLGATALEPVSDVGGGIRVAAVKDPFGNRFGIIENPNFKPSDVR